VATGEVRLEYRDYAFLGDESTRAAEAAMCGDDQGKFWQYHDTIFLNHDGENTGAYSDDRLKEMAEKVGLNMDQFNQCLDSGQHADDVQAMVDEARSLGLPGTPSFVVNGQVIDYNGYASVTAAIEQALAQ
jgi:protein-disulfide isomerase